MSDMKSLESTYAGFEDPTLTVKIDGTKVDSDMFLFTDLDVVVTSGYEASVCSLTVLSPESKFEDDKLKVDDRLDKFKIGSKIEVSLGYHIGNVTGGTDETKVVFSGIITSVRFELQAPNQVYYYVESMDVKCLMMENIRSEIKKDVKKHSAAVESVLKQYSSFYADVKIDATEELGLQIEQYNQSDYDFVVDLAKKSACFFYVVAGVVYFTKYAASKDTSVKLSATNNLYLFSRETSIYNQLKKFTVKSNDILDPETLIEGSATTVDTVGSGSKVSSSVAGVIDDKMEKSIVDNSVASVNEAKARAEAEFLKSSLTFVGGKVETVGIPDIEPGKYIEIEGLSDNYNGKYFVISVQHIFNEDGYKTICEFGANKI